MTFHIREALSGPPLQAEVAALPELEGPGIDDAELEGAQGLASTTGARSPLRAATVASLMQDAASGSQGAWAELVRRFGGMVAAVGRRYGLRAADVAELQQTTWLRLVENIHRIEQPERVGGWLATTARRESLQLLRRAAKYHSGADQMLTNIPDHRLPEPDAAADRGRTRRPAAGRLGTAPAALLKSCLRFSSPTTRWATRTSPSS